jgi:site-specific recombinase XerD
LQRAAQKRRPLDQFPYWLQTHPRVKPYSPRSIQAYSEQAALFQRWLDDNALNILKITKEDIIDHFSDMAATGYAPATIGLRHVSIRILFKFLIDKGSVKTNPALDIPIQQARENSGQPYTAGEVAKMYQACRDYQERAVYMLLLGTGIRRSEVARISRDDCNFEVGTIRILRKGGAYQYIKPEPAVIDAVEAALEFDDRLCPQKRGADFVYRLVQRLAERANIPGRHHPHRLRFTFAVAWCEAGGQESELMMALGHSTMRMTLKYSRVGREQRAMRSMQTIGIAARMLAGAPVALREVAG